MALVNGLGNLILANVVDYIDTTATYVAIGTGTTAVGPSDTALETEVLRNARQDHAVTTDTVTISGYITSTQANAEDITEVGVLTADVGGTLYSHDLHTLIAKTASIEIWYDITYTIAVTLNV